MLDLGMEWFRYANKYLENLVQMLCLLIDSFALGTRWSAFQAGKVILGFVLYSKSLGEFIGFALKFGEECLTLDNFLAAVILIVIPLYIVPCIIIYSIFGYFFVME